ncbi:AI-2E family transporter [Alkalibaculum sp. M08DMB]|uniref:AI-2E family transporter n=1 Tax=Alkalibaculum sporogenes TaxID=2655001 RepID=A0A6A7K7H9_9FIRM|nr:AI-2E family transporter [Alkalibaculum sporogenes]MPW25053.1 AI-2E family transporter [Alkalibaculum sporogenes]
MIKFKMKSEYKPYLYLGITICTVLIFNKLLENTQSFISVFSNAINFILIGFKPLLWGLIITYFFYRPVTYVEKTLLKINIFKRHVKVSRIISIIIIYTLSLFLMYLTLSFVIPQIWKSIRFLFQNIPYYIEEIQRLIGYFGLEGVVDNYLINIVDYSANIVDMSNNIHEVILELINNNHNTIDNAIVFIFDRIVSFTSILVNLTIALFVALYLLLDKEVIARQVSNISKFIISKSSYNKIIKTMMLIDEMFYKFFIGKIYCSIFVSLIVFIGLVALKVQHAVLITIIVAVTNIIPYFGPIIGGILGVIITLLFSPLKALWVLILVIIAQQLDDNILGPRVLGNRIGLNPFWIIVAVVLGGKLFGIKGMFLAVPTFAVIKVLITQWMITWRGKNSSR